MEEIIIITSVTAAVIPNAVATIMLYPIGYGNNHTDWNNHQIVSDEADNRIVGFTNHKCTSDGENEVTDIKSNRIR